MANTTGGQTRRTSGKAKGPAGCGTTRYLLPIRNEDCYKHLVEWLADNGSLSACQFLLLHVVEPDWWSDIPQSGSQALHLLDKHKTNVDWKALSLQAMTHTLSSKFPSMHFLSMVSSGPVSGAHIAQIAGQWQADHIVLFTDRQRGFRPFGTNRLIKQILDTAPCAVHIQRPAPAQTPVETAIIVPWPQTRHHIDEDETFTT